MPEVKIRGRSRRLSRILATLFISLLAISPFVLHSWQFVQIALLQTLDNAIYDAKINIMRSAEPDPRIVIVDVDDASLLQEGQWPWPRSKIAQLVDNLFTTYGARAVGFDIVFAEPDRVTQGVQDVIGELLADSAFSSVAREKLQAIRSNRDTDAELARALAGRPTVLGYIFTDFTSESADMKTGALPLPIEVRKVKPLQAYPYAAFGYLANLPSLQAAARTGGFFDNPLVDADGVYRRVPLLQFHEGEVYESLALALLRVAHALPLPVLGTHENSAAADVDYVQVGGYRIPVDDNLGIRVPFRGRQGSFPYISAVDVLQESASIDTLFDAVVLVGTTAAGLFDLRSTPVGKTYAGVEIHANIISGILDGRIYYQPDWTPWYDSIAMVAVAVILAIALPLLSPLLGAVFVLALILFGVMLNFVLAFGGYIFLPLAGFVAAALLVSLVLTGINAVTERRKKRYLSRTFAKYVPSDLVAQFEATEAEVTLEGESREMSVLFSDIRNFTSISEHLPPTALTQMMNHYLTPVTHVIQHYRGNVDKYIGDAVMAFWGAPLENPAHARDAVAAALGMQQALDELREDFRQRGWPELKMGIGINTAVVNIGNMGSAYRTAYTVMGDGVNLASRLEGLSKMYDAPIVVSEYTVAQALDFCFRELDRVRVKGKEVPITIYEPLGLAADLPPLLEQEMERYLQALNTYRQRDWRQAQAAFQILCETYPGRLLYSIYRARATAFMEQAPPDDWDGVYSLQTK